MVGLASHEKIFSGCCSRHKSTHPLTFILNRLITSAAVCCAVQAECVHSLLGVTAAIVSLCSKGFCTWMSVVLATIAGSLILIHSNSMQKGFVCTTSAGFNTNFLPKGFQGIIKTVFHCVSPSCWCPAATCLTPPLSLIFRSQTDLTHSSPVISPYFQLFSPASQGPSGPAALITQTPHVLLRSITLTDIVHSSRGLAHRSALINPTVLLYPWECAGE